MIQGRSQQDIQVTEVFFWEVHSRWQGPRDWRQWLEGPSVPRQSSCSILYPDLWESIRGPPHHWSSICRSICQRFQTCPEGKVGSIFPRQSSLAWVQEATLSHTGKISWRKSGQIIHGTHKHNSREYCDINPVADRCSQQLTDALTADWCSKQGQGEADRHKALHCTQRTVTCPATHCTHYYIGMFYHTKLHTIHNSTVEGNIRKYHYLCMKILGQYRNM